MFPRPYDLLGRLRDGERVQVFLVLISVDLVFVLLTVLAEPRWLFDMTRDNSLAEWFQYGKAVAIAWLLVNVARRSWSRAYLVWSCTFVYVAADDAFRIHESVGGVIGDRWLLNSMGDLAYSYGQLLYALAIGVIILGAITWVWLRGEARDRSLTVVMAAFLGAFVACAVGLDFVASWLRAAEYEIGFLNVMLWVVEELGEHFALSACTWAAVVEVRSKAPGLEGT